MISAHDSVSKQNKWISLVRNRFNRQNWRSQILRLFRNSMFTENETMANALWVTVSSNKLKLSKMFNLNVSLVFWALEFKSQKISSHWYYTTNSLFRIQRFQKKKSIFNLTIFESFCSFKGTVSQCELTLMQLSKRTRTKMMIESNEHRSFFIRSIGQLLCVIVLYEKPPSYLCRRSIQFETMKMFEKTFQSWETYCWSIIGDTNGLVRLSFDVLFCLYLSKRKVSLSTYERHLDWSFWKSKLTDVEQSHRERILVDQFIELLPPVVSMAFKKKVYWAWLHFWLWLKTGKNV